ncbi:glycine zipper 2TM domain-containing protein [Herbaspirillum sp. RTI4]|uniref:glycine zipper 2TM domain-containing protein n=1 Tax=Herbaspirillum sp. RTI4 TaxID=3048640 RepID=UPI002AB48AEC|nr:glycine zipper 2TM domain-containing protein [Herbaspirillum sp. RTI4]MDY7579738.1 glycine zipper 2TM domain-containing protein [Herbaspirillum sp. RTI4]MEA9982712.1 glycine zipper 2TM domain-containing protein [Herbaspirillum sp. RTI4]
MKKVIVAVVAITALTGCAVPSDSASVYRTGRAQSEQNVRMAVVESVRNVSIDKGGSSTDVGTVGGAALGGLAASSAIGQGRGALAAGVVGALAGGVLGNQIGDRFNRRAGIEITVRLESGELRAITQDADENFKVGERVRLLSSGGVTRVTH